MQEQLCDAMETVATGSGNAPEQLPDDRECPDCGQPPLVCRCYPGEG